MIIINCYFFIIKRFYNNLNSFTLLTRTIKRHTLN